MLSGETGYYHSFNDYTYRRDPKQSQHSILVIDVYVSCAEASCLKEQFETKIMFLI